MTGVNNRIKMKSSENQPPANSENVSVFVWQKMPQSRPNNESAKYLLRIFHHGHYFYKLADWSEEYQSFFVGDTFYEHNYDWIELPRAK